jgi:hypothetical protein
LCFVLTICDNYLLLVGPRTGEGVFPGEIVEVVQSIDMNSNTFLRLADDRGWVFCTHPTNMTMLFTQVPRDQYSYIERPSKYKIDRALVCDM